MSCSQQSASLVDSPWRQATGGSRRSTITTTVSASIARCAKRISKDRASSPREVDHSARIMHASCIPQIMYNTDTVYSTMIYDPVLTSHSPAKSPNLFLTSSPSLFEVPPSRKLVTPRPFDEGLFSDIRSLDGKVLSTVTVDKVHSSSYCNISDVPSDDTNAVGIDAMNKYELRPKSVNDVVRTETFTNEDVLKIKLTPILTELDEYIARSATPYADFINPVNTLEPVNINKEYVSNNFSDLSSYHLVQSVCKSTAVETNSSNQLSNTFETIERSQTPSGRDIADQLSRLDVYLQDKIDMSDSYSRITIPDNLDLVKNVNFSKNSTITETSIKEEIRATSSNVAPIQKAVETVLPENHNKCPIQRDERDSRQSKIVKSEKSNIFSKIYNLPFHYHAAIICFILVIFNLLFQEHKKNVSKL